MGKISEKYLKKEKRRLKKLRSIEAPYKYRYTQESLKDAYDSYFNKEQFNPYLNLLKQGVGSVTNINSSRAEYEILMYSKMFEKFDMKYDSIKKEIIIS